MNVHAADNPASRVGDIVTMVVQSMRQKGVVGLPRNYELFYEACTGVNAELGRDLAALGRRPGQDDLDRLGQKYFAANHGPGMMESTREQIAHELDDVMKLLIKERNSLEKYGRILDQTAEGLTQRHMMTTDILQKIAAVMAAATDTTIDHGRHIASSIDDKSSELEKVKSKLEEYKRLADTDPLTQIWNRRAFDRAMAGIFDTRRAAAARSTLVLADIDRFKDINDRFGHPVGDKIIQIVAGLVRQGGRDAGFAARTGGEEFALVVDGQGEDAARQMAEQIRDAVERTKFINKNTGVDYGPVTVSIGVCTAANAESAEDLYAKADRSLYKSKVGGRNRVTVFAPDDEARTGKSWALYRKD